MSLLEVPSLVCPYVYEEPIEKPYKEFINALCQVKQEHDNNEQEKKDNVCKEQENQLGVKTEELEVNETESIKRSIQAPHANTYFDTALGGFLGDIGESLVKEYVQNEIVEKKKLKILKRAKSFRSVWTLKNTTRGLVSRLDEMKKINAPFSLTQKKCDLCSFQSESLLVVAKHLEIPHKKNNLFQCNFCPDLAKTGDEIIKHMSEKHNFVGKLDESALVQCPNCVYEDKSKAKVAQHTKACSKTFKCETNLCPPANWEPPAIIPKINELSHPVKNPSEVTDKKVSLKKAQAKKVKVARKSASISPKVARPKKCNSIMAWIMKTRSRSQPQPSTSKSKPGSVPPTPPESACSATEEKKSIVCEICDGKMQQIKHLYSHFQFIHNVHVHPKTANNTPHLTCDRCFQRFFTDQGLDRHWLGAHGLISPAMEQAAKIGMDSGRCIICGNMYQSKLVCHVTKDHNITLTPAQISFKCKSCTAAYKSYLLFVEHIFMLHGQHINRNEPLLIESFLKTETLFTDSI